MDKTSNMANCVAATCSTKTRQSNNLSLLAKFSTLETFTDLPLGDTVEKKVYLFIENVKSEKFQTKLEDSR